MDVSREGGVVPAIIECAPSPWREIEDFSASALGVAT